MSKIESLTEYLSELLTARVKGGYSSLLLSEKAIIVKSLPVMVKYLEECSKLAQQALDEVLNKD